MSRCARLNAVCACRNALMESSQERLISLLEELLILLKSDDTDDDLPLNTYEYAVMLMRMCEVLIMNNWEINY